MLDATDASETLKRVSTAPAGLRRGPARRPRNPISAETLKRLTAIPPHKVKAQNRHFPQLAPSDRGGSMLGDPALREGALPQRSPTS